MFNSRANSCKKTLLKNISECNRRVLTNYWAGTTVWCIRSHWPIHSLSLSVFLSNSNRSLEENKSDVGIEAISFAIRSHINRGLFCALAHPSIAPCSHEIRGRKEREKVCHRLQNVFYVVSRTHKT
jgi:hypothetical protein